MAKGFSLVDELNSRRADALKRFQSQMFSALRAKGIVPTTSGVVRGVPDPASGDDIMSNVQAEVARAYLTEGPRFMDRQSVDAETTYRNNRFRRLSAQLGSRDYAYDRDTGRRVKKGTAPEGETWIGLGFNMDDPDAREKWDDVFGGAVDFDQVKEGNRPLSRPEIQALFDYTVQEKEAEISIAAGPRPLTQNQRIALLGASIVNPTFIQSVAPALAAGNDQAVVDAMLYSGAPTRGPGGEWTDAETGIVFSAPFDSGQINDAPGASREGGKRRHRGYDIPQPRGTAIRSMADGVVVAVKNIDGDAGGRRVYVEHTGQNGRKIQSWYMHMDKFAVRVGDRVKRGQTLGTVGGSGRYGPNDVGNHLHAQFYDPARGVIDAPASFGWKSGYKWDAHQSYANAATYASFAGTQGNMVPSFGDYQSSLKGGSVSGRKAEAMSFFLSKGYSQVQAAGIVGNLVQESGPNLRTDWPGDGGKSVGIAQWNGSRLAALKRFAGPNWQDFRTQLAFVDHELRTTETNAFANLQRATTVEAATQAFIGYERPLGYTPETPWTGHGYANRLTFARQLI